MTERVWRIRICFRRSFFSVHCMLPSGVKSSSSVAGSLAGSKRFSTFHQRKSTVFSGFGFPFAGQVIPYAILKKSKTQESNVRMRSFFVMFLLAIMMIYQQLFGRVSMNTHMRTNNKTVREGMDMKGNDNIFIIQKSIIYA